jgi:hypothetical protein
MNLNQYAAERRRELYEDLSSGLPPRDGAFDEHVWKTGKAKGQAPQMGSTRFEPNALCFEFIYPDSAGVSTVFTVKLNSPERIVYLPVPTWVIESIWQGDVSGSFHFESDAARLIEDLKAELEPQANLKWFGPQAAKRRE